MDYNLVKYDHKKADTVCLRSYSQSIFKGVIIPLIIHLFIYLYTAFCTGAPAGVGSVHSSRFSSQGANLCSSWGEREREQLPKVIQ